MPMEIVVRDGLGAQHTVATNDAVVGRLNAILAELGVGSSETSLATIIEELQAVTAAINSENQLKIARNPVTMGSSFTVNAAPGAATALISAGSRVGLLVYNEGPETVYIQTSNVLQKSPMPIGAGGVFPIYLAQALWVYNPGSVSTPLFSSEIL